MYISWIPCLTFLKNEREPTVTASSLLGQTRFQGLPPLFPPFPCPPPSFPLSHPFLRLASSSLSSTLGFELTSRFRCPRVEQKAESDVSLHLLRLVHLSLLLWAEPEPRAHWILTLHRKKRQWLPRACLCPRQRTFYTPASLSQSCSVYSIQHVGNKKPVHSSKRQNSKPLLILWLSLNSNPKLAFLVSVWGQHVIYWQGLITSEEWSLLVRLQQQECNTQLYTTYGRISCGWGQDGSYSRRLEPGEDTDLGPIWEGPSYR